MCCDEHLPLVEKLADGECTESERARVEAHLAKCESCREHLRFIQALPEASRKVPLPEPPGAYWDVLPRKIMARIDDVETTRASRGWLTRIFSTPRLRWLGAVAAGVIAVVLSYEVLNVEPDVKPAAVQKQVVEPALDEEPAPAEPPEAPLDGASGEAESRIDPDEAPRRVPPSTPSPEETAPVRVDEGGPIPTGAVKAHQESDSARPSAGAPESSEPAPARYGAARVRARVESEDVPVAVMAEGMRKSVEAPRPPEAAPKLEGTEPPPGESTEPRSGAEETGKRGKLEVVERAAGGRKGLDPVAFREEDRRTSSNSGGDLEVRCRLLRDSLQSVETDEREEVLYALAKCSFDLYHARRTEEDRDRAREDASAFLEVASGGERADEIRELLDQIK